MMAGGPPPSMGGMGGPSDQAGGGPEDEPISLVSQIIEACKKYLGVEPDEEDKLLMTKILGFAQQLLAKDQQDKDAALGGQNVRLLRKAG